jgi:hypothetical protein
LWKASYTISVSTSINVQQWLPYSMNNLLSCVVMCPSQWFFYLGEEIISTWTHIRWVGWMFQYLPLWAVKDILDSVSSMSPRILPLAIGDIGTSAILTQYESRRLWSLHQNERITARDTFNTREEIIHAVRWSLLDINRSGCTDGVWRLPQIWQKVVHMGSNYTEGMCVYLR